MVSHSEGAVPGFFSEPGKRKIRPYYPELIQGWRLFDIALVTAALYLLALYWSGAFEQRHLLLTLFASLLMQVTYSSSVYRVRIRTAAAKAMLLLRAWLTVLVVLVVIGLLTGALRIFSPGLLLSWAISAYLLQLTVHLGFALILQRLRARGYNIRFALLVGAEGGMIESFRGHLEELRSMGIRPIGFVEPVAQAGAAADTGETRLPRLGGLEDVSSLVERLHVEEIYILSRKLDEATLRETVVDHLLSLPANITLVPASSILDALSPRAVDLGGRLVYRLNESPMHGMPMVLKRLEDILLSLVLLVLLSPLLVGIIVAIKATSPGPILFTQKRHGRGGREVTIWKFRTMTWSPTAADTPVQASPGDARVMPLGRFLRRWSLDELPQFFNVLQGRMSFVGPRPHPVWLNHRFQEQIAAYMQRHRVRPGITGWAQVNGLRGETDTLEKMENRLRHDLFYINNWSLWLDQKIIMRTILAVFQGTNAH